jgi:hypothetical protein
MTTHAAELVVPLLERLSWTEIRARFPDRWVVLVDIVWVNDTDFEFTAATVLSLHVRRRDASPDIKAARANGAEVGCFWTGEIRAPFPRMIVP